MWSRQRDLIACYLANSTLYINPTECHCWCLGLSHFSRGGLLIIASTQPYKHSVLNKDICTVQELGKTFGKTLSWSREHSTGIDKSKNGDKNSLLTKRSVNTRSLQSNVHTQMLFHFIKHKQSNTSPQGCCSSSQKQQTIS